MRRTSPLIKDEEGCTVAEKQKQANENIQRPVTHEEDAFVRQKLGSDLPEYKVPLFFKKTIPY